MARATPNKRAVDVLSLLFDRTWVSIEDVVSLHISNIKYARRFMADLCRKGWARQVQCHLFEEKGGGRSFYCLTKQGYRQLFLSPRTFKEQKDPTSSRLLHHYTINTVLTGFKVLALQHPGLTAETMTERQIREHNRFHSHVRGASGPASIIIPDFLLCVGDGVSKTLFLGEADACTEAISTYYSKTGSIQAKFETYSAYQELGIFKFFDEVFKFNFSGFSYIHLTAGSDTRVGHLLHSCRSIPGNILITTLERVRPIRAVRNHRPAFSYDNLAAPVWRRPGDDPPCSILMS